MNEFALLAAATLSAGTPLAIAGLERLHVGHDEHGLVEVGAKHGPAK